MKEKEVEKLLEKIKSLSDTDRQKLKELLTDSDSKELVVSEDEPDLVEELPEEIKPIILKLPKEEQESAAKSIMTFMSLTISATHWEGPLPPAWYFKEIEEIIPGGAERILKSFEKQTEHRQNLESKIINKLVKAKEDKPLVSYLHLWD